LRILPIFYRKFSVAALFLLIVLSYMSPLVGAAVDPYVTVFEQDFSKLTSVPQNIRCSFLESAPPELKLTKNSTDDYLTITKRSEDSGTVTIYGFTPSIRCRYTIELSWNNTGSTWSGSGVYIGIGGARLHLYSSGTGSKFYLRGQYYNVTGKLVSSAFVWDLGSDNHVSISVESDTITGMTFVSAKNYSAKLPYFRVFWSQDKSANIFSPDTISLAPLSSNSAGPNDLIVVKLFKLSQEIRSDSLATAIGSTKYQAFGYDGPHPANTVVAGMNEIRAAGMNATIFADIDYVKDEGFVQYLKGLVASGWEVGIHFSEGLSDLRWSDAKVLMSNEYETISDIFGSPPITWCSLGNIDNSTHSLYAKQILNMVCRSWRVVPQNLPGSHDIVNSNFDYWLNAAESGVSTAPMYAHQTEIEPAVSQFSIDASKFDTWLSAIKTNGIKLVGYYKWYMINSNQMDAKFVTTVVGNETKIKVDTNGYNSFVLLKIKADEVVSFKMSGKSMEYSLSPQGYLIFEAVDGGEYAVVSKPVIIDGSDGGDAKGTSIYLYVGVAFVIVTLAVLFVWQLRRAKPRMVSS
jgi:hypothetical protein